MNLAKFLSNFLGPQVWLPGVLVASMFKTGLNSGQVLILFPILLFFQILVPFAGPFLAARMGMVQDFDVPDRQERPFFMVVALITYLIALFFARIFGSPLLFKINLALFILTAVIFLITLLWKVSVHMATVTASTIVLNYLFGYSLPMLYLAIPLVFWARLKLKRHTVWQLVGGILVAVIVVVPVLLFR